MQIVQNRRTFLAGATAAGVAGLVGRPTPLRAEPAPETTTVRLPVLPKVSDCQAPMYAATELLHAEGLTDIKFVLSGTGPDSSDWIAHGEIDFDWNFPPAHVLNIGRGVPIKVLSGMHVGCIELIASDKIAGVLDLKGKRVGVDAVNSIGYLLLNIMTAYIGLDPANDFETVEAQDAVQSLAEGKIDAFLGTPPQPQQARERNVGHVILTTAVDKPWSQYFCCMLASTADYADRYPIATKRVLRAMLKAIDLCTTDPGTVAKAATDIGYASNYDYALQALSDARYGVWREYDPEDSVRFYALRMEETKAITMSPQEVLARGTDWRFLDEVKRGLKI
jgi:NitT/TauT family transport system substrate-binding protein